MIIVKVYSVMGRCHLELEASSAIRGGVEAPLTPTILHRANVPLEQVESADGLARAVEELLRYANGYAGDLIDHVTS